ncbi:hypothetical protein OC926_01905 [Pseudomonas peradeniyensis]|uniref:hypothetical protein n=1 Tax=Pseudomonas TaxID=286 RepID=UPI0012E150BB|nr:MULTISPECIES: hypothetical protein [Pseudomonas]MCU7278584.1 hypothetical protein [Pseudomonas peradeniyensis]QZA54545.1 hypothetical protein K2O50_00325 [Pseudomonas sp. 2hn]
MRGIQLNTKGIATESMLGVAAGRVERSYRGSPSDLWCAVTQEEKVQALPAWERACPAITGEAGAMHRIAGQARSHAEHSKNRISACG